MNDFWSVYDEKAKFFQTINKMLENESILSKNEYEEYKVSLSDVFKPSKKVSQDNFSHYKTHRFIYLNYFLLLFFKYIYINNNF